MKEYIKRIIYFFFPTLKRYHLFMKSQTNKVTMRQFLRFCCSRDKRIYWPVHNNSEITHPENIYVGINSNAGTRPGCYIQGNGGIYIGDYVRFASNVGIISGNHDLYDHTKHNNREVKIGDYTWVGMNAIVLPGVELGPRTIVAAGSVVTKSFPEGFCVIGGNPAKLIKNLEKDSFIPTKYPEEYYGYVPKTGFKIFAKKYLKNNKYYEHIIRQ